MMIIFIIIMMVIILKYTENLDKEAAKKKEKVTSEKKTGSYRAVGPDPDGSRTEGLVRQKLFELFGIRPAISVLLPAGDMNTEIDLVQATTKGIFVVECKSRMNSVSGDIKADFWSVGSVIDAVSMENPVKQNYYHVLAVQRYLKPWIERIPVYNVVVMLNSSMHITGLDMVSELKFFTDVDAMDALKNLPDIISEDAAKELQELLYKKEGTVNELEKHVENVKNKYNN